MARHAIRTRRCREEPSAPFITSVRKQGAFRAGTGDRSRPRDQARQPPRHGLDLIAPSRRENGHRPGGRPDDDRRTLLQSRVPRAGGRRRAPDLRPQPDRPRVRASAPAAGRRGPRGRARVRGPGRLRLGAGDPGRRPRQRDSDLPGPPQAQDRGGPWSEPRQRDREGPDGDQGGRRRAPEGRQAGQGGRETLARGGEAAELGHVAVSSTGPSGRQRRARAGPRDLHAPRAIATAGSADPAHRRRAHRDDHQGHGRGRSADHELPDDADAHQRHLRARRDRGRLPHRPPVRLPVGLPRGRPPLHPLRRTLGGRRRGQPRRAGRLRRLDPARPHRGAVHRARADHRLRRGTLLLQPERRRVPGRAPAGGGLLDVDLGADRAGAGHAAHRLPRGPGEVRPGARDRVRR